MGDSDEIVFRARISENIFCYKQKNIFYYKQSRVCDTTRNLGNVANKLNY